MFRWIPFSVKTLKINASCVRNVAVSHVETGAVSEPTTSALSGPGLADPGIARRRKSASLLFKPPINDERMSHGK